MTSNDHAAAQGEALLRSYASAVEDAHADLTRMDRLAGDGDFGDNLRAGMRLVVRRLDAGAGTAALQTAADVFLDEVGGTSGPLFGLLFSELARAAAAQPDPTSAWREGLAAGLSAIQRVGEAEPGDRTLVDALAPAVDALAGGTLADAATAAVDGARATASLRARRGRASYVGDRGAGVMDPGAVAVAVLLLVAARELEPGAAGQLIGPDALTAG
ncbi:DAK2 domain-containing protein [Auraticoccus sp. F435]|uniref:DAK2 domain-containing protein n=1 Tax=Auraticoccus cholistanensis TaxID=2656650 RepID=A0A6A9V0V4_9ACTN|nr:DAK2 domain-containing protein [Auraticoccus cholistanensis]MVA76309.1 DAK2 domain-containing protein [Auraticoccus cholistanensis]